MTENKQAIDKFIKDLGKVSKESFNASDRLKYESEKTNSFAKLLVFLSLAISLILVVKSSSINASFTQALTFFNILSSIYIFIFLSNDKKKNDSKRFLKSGNFYKLLKRQLENQEISLNKAQDMYTRVLDFNHNVEDIDHQITSADIQGYKKLQKKLKIKYERKIRCTLTVQGLILFGLTVIVLFI